METLPKETELEMKIGSELSKYMKKNSGKGPTRTETHFLNNLIIIKISGFLSLHEKHYARSESGSMEVKINRLKLVNHNKEEILDIATMVTGKRINKMFYDLDSSNDIGYVIFEIS